VGGLGQRRARREAVMTQKRYSSVHRVHKACLMNMTGQQDNTVMDIGVMDNSGATITYSFDANSNPQRASVAIFYQNLVEAGVIAKWWVIAKPDADSP
jgi:hypothetical protein